MLFWGLCSLFFGGLLGGYCRLRYAAKMLFLSWQQLVDLALKKRELFHEMVLSFALPPFEREEEISFLRRVSAYSLQQFLKASNEDFLTFYEMEQVFTFQLKRILAALKELTHEASTQDFIEELLAYENAFSFRAYAFEKAAETYVSLQNHLMVRLAGKFFGFPKVPLLSFS
ncbi:hypothetical protein [Chlamydia sp.]|uniref:hypothetical protein n=1 Tax=Chlamydia sp. TaxID=35827 RepID=UPI0025B9E96B|nr:hypothetical protein [Chlamydia sp.]MBQ8498781.1 hypothetical protein [Chlamydia sp.]